MRRALMILTLTAAPAAAGDGLSYRRDCEYRGPISSWPEVRQARAFDRLCPAQQMAVIAGQKAALEAVTPSLYRPSYDSTRSAVAAPAAAPPPPWIPASDRLSTPPSRPTDQPSPFRSEGTSNPSGTAAPR